MDSEGHELLQLIESTIALLEQQADSGSWGLPTDPTVASASAREGSSIDAPQVATRLKSLGQRVSGCTLCALHAARQQVVLSRGDGSSGLLFVGEGPGAEEDRQGIPFVGAAGQLLDRMITAMGLNPAAVFVCNVVKCRPPNNRKPTPIEAGHCLPYLREQIETLQPRVIIALGATATEGLLGLKTGITRIRGQWHEYGDGIPVMPTYHPAYLLRKPEAKREVWKDLQQVVAALGKNTTASE